MVRHFVPKNSRWSPGRKRVKNEKITRFNRVVERAFGFSPPFLNEKVIFVTVRLASGFLGQLEPRIKPAFFFLFLQSILKSLSLFQLQLIKSHISSKYKKSAKNCTKNWFKIWLLSGFDQTISRIWKVFRNPRTFWNQQKQQACTHTHTPTIDKARIVVKICFWGAFYSNFDPVVDFLTTKIQTPQPHTHTQVQHLVRCSHLSASFRSRFQSRQLSRATECDSWRRSPAFAYMKLNFFMANVFATSKEDFNSSYIIGSYFRLLLRFLIFCVCGSAFKLSTSFSSKRYLREPFSQITAFSDTNFTVVPWTHR